MNLLSRLAELLDIDLDQFFERDKEIKTVLAGIMSSLGKDVAAAKRHVSAVIAMERQIARELHRHQQAAKRWQHHSLLAIARERHDVSQRAIARKHWHERQIEELKSEHSAAREATFSAKNFLRTLEDCAAQAGQRQRLILARSQLTLWRQNLGQGPDDSAADPETALAAAEEYLCELEAMRQRLASG
jgi:phage shock protein A